MLKIHNDAYLSSICLYNEQHLQNPKKSKFIKNQFKSQVLFILIYNQLLYKQMEDK
jgi:hypothetical protein